MSNRRRILFGGLATSIGASLLRWQTSLAGTEERSPSHRPGDEPTSVRRFGARGDGVADDTAAVAAAVAGIRDGGTLVFPAGGRYRLTEVDLTGKAVTLIAYGAEIICAMEGKGAIRKSDHGKKLTICGGRFTGRGIGVRWVTGTSTTQYDDFLLVDVKFMNADYGVYLDGVREGALIGCSFDGTFGNKGVYRVRTVNTQLIGCNWKNTAYMVNDDGDYSPYSAGLVINGGVAIGCATGVYSQGTDLVTITGGVVIDYCDAPVVLRGVDCVEINGGCYLSSRALRGGGSNPALDVNLADNGDPTRNLKIGFISTLNHSNGAGADCIRLRGVASGFLVHCTISFFRRFGIDFAGCTRFQVNENTLARGAGSPATMAIIESADGDSSNGVSRNDTGGLRISTLFARVEGNLGFATEGCGEAMAAADASAMTVKHGLSYTPAKSEIVLTATNREAANARPYIAAVSPTTFTIGFASATTSSASVAWHVKRKTF
nr:glycosyl hydrolase family 28-related protein [Cupriavidus necator]